MSTARQVVDPYVLPTSTLTPKAGIASWPTQGLQPTTSPAWWWGVATGAQVAAGNTAAAPAPPAQPPAPTKDCGCG